LDLTQINNEISIADSVTTTVVDSALHIFDYLFNKFGSASAEVDQMMDIFNCVFDEELSSELQRQVELAKVNQLITTLSVTRPSSSTSILTS
jgi:hypothetical protein